MKAYQIQEYGDAARLELKEALKPTIGDNEVLVNVVAASVNPVDYKIRSGAAKLILRYKMPLTLGHDFSGIVTEVGKNVQNFAIGDHVYGRTPTTGSFQEYVKVSPNDIAQIPSNISLVEAASVPLVGLTAYQGLFDWMSVKEGQSVLILGGSGGVGHVAVQLALWAKATVYTTASKQGIEFLEPYGDIKFIDYNSQTIQDVVQSVDAVFDMRGGSDLVNAFEVVRRGGEVASIATIPTLDYAKRAKMSGFVQGVIKVLTRKNRKLAKEKNVHYSAFLTLSNHEMLATITRLIEEQKISVHIQKVYTADEINDAVEIVKKGRVKGKVVIDFQGWQ